MGVGLIDILVGKHLKDVVGYPEASYMRSIAVMIKDQDGHNKCLGECFHLREFLRKHPEFGDLKIIEARTYLDQLVFQVKEVNDES